MNEAQATRPTERRFPWLDCIGAAALLLVLVGLVFPNVSGPGPGAVKRAQAQSDVDQICVALKLYHTEYGVLPSGDKAQIMTALHSANPRGIVFFEAASSRFNARGEFLDPWGTPFRLGPSDPAFPWAYSFGNDAKDDGGAPGSDDISSWR